MQIFQIYYDEETKKSLSPGLIPLDNVGGDKDWYEFTPIINFLNANELKDGAWYGFVSPKFFEKTDTDLARIKEFLIKSEGYDVALFSSNWCALVLHENVWVQGESCHPGFLKEINKFFKISRGKAVNHLQLVPMELSVFSNYFIAKKEFWLRWREIANDFFDYIENLERMESTEMTGYKNKKVPLKVFMQERLVNYMLQSGNFSVAAADYSEWERQLEANCRFAKGTFSFILLKHLLLQLNKIKAKHFHKGSSYLIVQYRCYKIMLYFIWRWLNRINKLRN